LGLGAAARSRQWEVEPWADITLENLEFRVTVVWWAAPEVVAGAGGGGWWEGPRRER
jgi:hypothetical protein